VVASSESYRFSVCPQCCARQRQPCGSVCPRNTTVCCGSAPPLVHPRCPGTYTPVLAVLTHPPTPFFKQLARVIVKLATIL
jgi:hypothetical protein